MWGKHLWSSSLQDGWWEIFPTARLHIFSHPPQSLKMKKVDGKWMASGAVRGAQCRERDKAGRVLWPREGVLGVAKVDCCSVGDSRWESLYVLGITGLTENKMVLGGTQ